MILTCPACSARYLIAGDAIGEQGRDVRCGKCGHNWTQEPVHDSLDELSRTNSPERAGLTKSSLDAAVESFLNDEIPDAVKPLPDTPLSPPLKKKSSPPKAKVSRERGIFSKNKSLVTGAASALALFALLAWVIVVAREPVIKALPFTKPVFVALGLEDKADAKTLVFDSVTAKIDGEELVLTGSLINLSASTISLPAMVVDLLDSAGAIQKTLPAEIEEKTLEGEQSLVLHLTFKDIPKGAEQARLRFADNDPEAESAHEPEEQTQKPPDPTTAEEGADNTHAQPEASSDHSNAHE